MKLARKRRVYLLAFIVLPLLAMGFVAARAFWPLPPIPLIVSRETTYFTEPLKPDGTVDYVAAYNERFGADVLPDQNMAIPLIKTLGPEILEPAARDAVIAQFGITFDNDAAAFVPLNEFVEAHAEKYQYLVPAEEKLPADNARALVDQAVKELFPDRAPLTSYASKRVQKAYEHPWTPDDYPIVADWLVANRVPLDRLVTAERRPKFFIPIISNATPPAFPGDARLDVDIAADVADGLACRVARKLADHDPAGAWRDALTICHLGRLFSQSGYVGGPLVSLLCRRPGARAVIRVAQYADVPAPVLRDWLDEYLRLPESRSAYRGFNFQSRLLLLESLAGSASTSRGIDSLGANVPSALCEFADINCVLRQINTAFDNLAASAQDPSFQTRQSGWEQEVARSSRSWERVRPNDFATGLGRLLASSGWKREIATDAVAACALVFLVPSVDPSIDSEIDINEAFAHAALGLAIYRAEHGSYPAALDALVPDILDEIPRDFFTGDSIVYDTDGQTYRLWSAGRDQINNHATPDSDDVVIESMPPAQDDGAAEVPEP